MDEVLSWSAVQMAQAIRAKTLSSEELVAQHLSWIETVNPRLNAVFRLNDQALALARAADQQLAKRADVGPLHGVPVTIKDWIDVAGLPCAGADTRHLERVPETDATVALRLRQAGGIILAKTTVLEQSDAYGQVSNPYKLSYSPTGSSSGEAVLIAACGSPVGLGSDSGGSIRQPAHVCGIAGLKPTTGRVPLSGHFPPIVPLNDPRTVIGPLARRADDLALVLPVIAGPDWSDASVIPMPLGDPNQVNLQQLRVAFYTEHTQVKPTPETITTVERVAAHLADICTCVERALPPRSEEIYPITQDYWNRLESDDLDTWQPQGHSKLDGDTVARHLFEWDRYRRDMLRFMQDWDIILTPAAERPAQPHSAPGSIAYTLAYSLTGYPCGVVRAGTTAEQTPIGVQIVGRPWQDDTVLAVMLEIESAFGGWQIPQFLE
jgi:amidase